MLKVAPKLRGIRGFGEQVKLIENDHLIVRNDLLRMQSTTQSGTASQQSGQLFSSLMSARTVSSIPGLTSLTTTSSPLSSLAQCTWAMDADASGCSSRLLKTSETGRPSRSLISDAT